jgi:hypothetical protein
LKVSSLITRLQIDNADPACGDRAELRFRAADVDCLLALGITAHRDGNGAQTMTDRIPYKGRILLVSREDDRWIVEITARRAAEDSSVIHALTLETAINAAFRAIDEGSLEKEERGARPSDARS